MLDFYLQCCAIEVNTASTSVIAATLANGGICPTTDEECLSPATIKSCLTLMFSCGLYGYSGEWMTEVGVPAKSGVSGVIYVVVPHVMGIAVYSPPIDSHGNSVRGVAFVEKLLRRFPLGMFDSCFGPLLPPVRPSTSAGTAPHAGSGRPPADGDTDTDSDDEPKDGKRPSRARPSCGDSAHRFQAEMLRHTNAVDCLIAFGRVHKALRHVGRAYSTSTTTSTSTTSSPLGASASSVSPLPPTPHHVHVSSLARFLSRHGIAAAKSSVVESAVLALPSSHPNWFDLSDLLRVASRDTGTRSVHVLLRALLAELVLPDFEEFTTTMKDLFDNTATTVPPDPTPGRGGVPSVDQEIRNLVRGNGSFALAVCSVDGQQFKRSADGTFDVFPLLDTVKPLLHALALRDCGHDVVSEFCGSHPSSLPPSSFDLMPPGEVESDRPGTSVQSVSVTDTPAVTHLRRASSLHEAPPAKSPAPFFQKAPRDHDDDRKDSGSEFACHSHPRPYHPFMDNGALVVSSLIGRGHARRKRDRKYHDTGSRFTLVQDALRDMAGGDKIGFNNTVFLTLKQRGLKTLALSHFAKGMEAYPARTNPTDIAHLYFQASVVEVTVEQLSVMAATLANLGTCPLTDKACLEPSVVRTVVSLMYSCGMKEASGAWAFRVGLPATSGLAGAVLVVVPSLMGMVLYDPKLNENHTTDRVVALCRSLVSRFRMSLFDQLVYRDKDIIVPAGEVADPQAFSSDHEMAVFFQLCTSVNAGDETAVRRLLQLKGHAALKSDYDLRTPLHIAASVGNLYIGKMLVAAGLNPTATDRWGKTPIDEARDNGHDELVKLLGAAERERALKVPSAAGGPPASSLARRSGHSASSSPPYKAMGPGRSKLTARVMGGAGSGSGSGSGSGGGGSSQTLTLSP